MRAGLTAAVLAASLTFSTLSAGAADFHAMALEAEFKSSTSLTKPGKTAGTDGAAIAAFYETRNFEPLWISENGLNQRARQMLKHLANAHEDGLNPNDYQPVTLDGFSPDVAHLADNQAALIGLEVQITNAALKYARHVRAGRINPYAVSKNLTPKLPVPDIAETLKGFAESSDLAEFLATLAPQHEGYKKLKAVLAELRKAATRSFTKVPVPNRVIRPGQIHEIAGFVRQRLIESNHYKPVAEDDAAAKIDLDRYDPALVKAVRAAQRQHGLRPDGIIGRGTVRALNAQSPNRMKSVLINMERFRWLPRDLGKRHVFVNQAAYQMRVIDDHKVIHTARIVVGKPKHQTPVFSDEIKFVVFNPYWNVPRSIIKNEMMPYLSQDPSWLERQGYEVRTTARARRSTGFFGWGRPELTANDIVSVRQPPGPRNALGRVKFLFPNKHSVYLHDTPSKYLFARPTRAYSHGCVRVQHATKFAEILLRLDAGWTPRRVSRAIASGRNQYITLKNKVPIHLTYFTAWVDDNGKLATRPDIYRRDRRLAQLLNASELAMK